MEKERHENENGEEQGGDKESLGNEAHNKKEGYEPDLCK
jgi:hypothetical protein